MSSLWNEIIQIKISFERSDPARPQTNMKNHRVVTLPVINIAAPCSEDWNAMDGDQRSRFCLKCQHDVFSSEELSAGELDRMSASGERVCMRLTVHPKKGVLTKEGWLPRMVTVGIAAVALSGCSQEVVGETIAVEPPAKAVADKPTSDTNRTIGKVAIPKQHITGTPAVK
jgi:hypothetical protein